MPPFVAVGWTIGATLLLGLLGALTIGLRPKATVDFVTAVGCEAAAYALTIFLILRVHAPDASIRPFLGLRRTHLAFYPLALLLGAALCPIAAALFQVVDHYFPTATTDDGAFDLLLSSPWPRKLMMVVAAMLVGPIVEEMLFRGALWRPLRKSYGGRAVPVIVTTALLFALVHLELQRWVHVGLIGLCLGFLRERSGSIVPSMLVHIAFDAVPIGGLLLMYRSRGPDWDVPHPLWLVAVCGLVVVALLGLIHLLGTRTDAARRAQELDQA